MPEIRNVEIRSIGEIGIPPIRSLFTGLPEPITTKLSPPVTVNIGTPIINVPGCVEANINGPGLIKDDPNGNVILCDGLTPSFNQLNYEPEGLVFTGPPQPIPKLANEITPSIPKVPEIPKLEPPNIPVVTVTEQKENTVEIVEENSFVQEYLPSAAEVSTTVTIATAAAAAAVFGKPLAEILLKLIKPLVKKTVQKVKTQVGVKEVLFSVSERRQLQRDLRK